MNTTLLTRLVGSSFVAATLLPLVLLVDGSGPVAAKDLRLCLWKVHEKPLRDFEPIGLTTSQVVGRGATITMWSQSALLVLQLSPTGEPVKSLVRRAIPSADPLSAALTHWDDDGPAVEVLDAERGETWRINMTTGEMTKGGIIPGATTASAALRNMSGWVQAHKVNRADVDTAGVVVISARGAGAKGDLGEALAKEPADRRIDRLLHLRSDNEKHLLVQEAGFPFATIGFTENGAETWRVVPGPEDIRDLLGETDLRYVIATPAMPLDNAVLNTFVALRSGRRIAAIRIPGASARYQEIPRDLAFLATFPTYQMLVGTRSGQPYELVIFSWRWIDQRERCTNRPT